MRVDFRAGALSSLVLAFVLAAAAPLRAQGGIESAVASVPVPRLTQIAVCEELRDSQPLDAAIVFSASTGRLICFNRFDNVALRTEIYHSWYHRDTLSSRVRLMLTPPAWSTYSTIQLRPQDLGPWRVEVTDADGRVLGLVRFSVTE
jgi:hypothetical protein